MPKSKNRKIIIAILSFSLIVGFSSVLKQKIQSANAKLDSAVLETQELAMMQENSLMQISSPKNPDPKVAITMDAVITAYSSTPWQTDEDPLVTAAGTAVRDGIVANNLLAFGTKIKMPSLYGDKIFVVEDRMNSRMEKNQFDIWFLETQDAKNFGVKNATVEILEN